jgi:tRNA-specific 2-thiouridylase
MSGGVDSAVAAARAVDAGHEVTGVHLALSTNPQSFRSGARGCCTLEDASDARRAADVLGIPFYVWDLAERFRADVVEDFVAEYAAGRTPNPCVRCNEEIKFSAVLDKAVALGFDAVCTGHYARLVSGPGGNRELHRAADPGKDQSYVLGVLTAGQLSRAMFPLGDTVKFEVRIEAARRGLAVAKPDSHDICFIADGDTAGSWPAGSVLAPDRSSTDRCRSRLPRRHVRLHGRPAQAAGAEPPGAGRKAPLCAEHLAGRRTVTVGPADRLAGAGRVRPRWCGRPPAGPVECLAQLRAHGDPLPAVAEQVGDKLLVSLRSPARGVAPGQAVVLYQGTRVLGSATIDRTTAASST